MCASASSARRWLVARADSRFIASLADSQALAAPWCSLPAFLMEMKLMIKKGSKSGMHPVLGRKLGRVGRSYAKIAAVGLAIGLAMALCASFAKYRYELTAFCLMTVNLFRYLLSLLLSSYS